MGSECRLIHSKKVGDANKLFGDAGVRGILLYTRRPRLLRVIDAGNVDMFRHIFPLNIKRGYNGGSRTVQASAITTAIKEQLLVVPETVRSNGRCSAGVRWLQEQT